MTKQNEPPKNSENEPKRPGELIIQLITGKPFTTTIDAKVINERAAALERLAKKIPCSVTLIRAVVYSDHPLTWEMSQKLAKVLGRTPNEWHDLSIKYQQDHPIQIVDSHLW